MDAKTTIKSRLPSRQVTEATERARRRSYAALHLPAIAHECGIKFDVAEIFKKTLYVAGLKPGGRYVAKDMFEISGIPLLTKTLLDNGHLCGDCLAVTGSAVAEIDADAGTLNVKLTGAELTERKTKWKARETNHTSGALRKYAQQVGPAVDGAVFHPGGAHKKQCYADI
jgi:dihydroxyacid dehydratase/phosphogluconate dehydratase